MCSKEHKDLKIKVENNYANEPLKGTNSVAAYMSLTNQSNEDINLNGIICQGSHKALLHKLKKNASKDIIKKSIEKIFKVNVIKVNTINLKGTTKMVRNKKTFVSGYKKAIITLKKGQSIDLATGI